MSIAVLHLLALVLGFLVCRLLLPLVMRAAWQFGWLDVPTEARRQHAAPVPRLGGVAIFFSVAVVVGSITWLAEYAGFSASNFPLPMAPIFGRVVLGALLIFTVGVADDLRGVSPPLKLLAQSVAALLVVTGGILPTHFALSVGGATWTIGPIVATLLAMLWIAGVTNAVNLIDGIDGLAGTTVVIALTVALIAEFIGGQAQNVTFSLATTGAVAGFLTLNWRPARIFLGDSGSMTLGYFLAVRTVYAATNLDTGTLYPVVPLFALAFPLLDTFTAMARRFVRKHPFSRAPTAWW